MTHEENNIGGGAELPGSDEQKVSRLLLSLKRVEAPKDFDFHLKARIARGRPEEMSTGSLFPILKYAIPLALFLAVGAGVMLQTSWNTGVSDTAVSQPQESGSVPAVSRDVPVVTGQTGPATEPANTVIAGTKPDIRSDEKAPPGGETVRPTRPDDERPGGGSRTETGGTSRKALIPPEFNVTNSNTPRNTNSASTPKPESLRDALKTMGVDVELEGNVWAVKNVGAGSFGGSMGIKPGDRVEAIDGTPVDRNTTFKGTFKARVITVRREGSLVELKPQN